MGRFLRWWALLLALAASPAAHGDRETVFSRTTHKAFADAVADARLAIEQQNFSIVAVDNVGSGIRSRGHAGFPEAVVLQFCNLEYAREALGIDPAYLVHMPCRIALYQNQGRVVVSVILLDENDPNPRLAAFAAKINRILKAIVGFAATDD